MVPTGIVLPAGETLHPFGSSIEPSDWFPGFTLADGITACANVMMRGVTAAPARMATNPKASLRIVVGVTTLWTIKRLFVRLPTRDTIKHVAEFQWNPRRKMSLIRICR